MKETLRNLVGKGSGHETQTPPDEPPPYDGGDYGNQNLQSAPNGQNLSYLGAPPPHEEQGSTSYPDEKKPGQFEPPGYPPNEYHNTSQSAQYPNSQFQGQNHGNQGQYDPMNDPNVIKVKPNMVNISQARPEHLNPSYPEFQARENERWKQGNTPMPREYFKHGAPLAPGHKGSSKTGGGAFPGSQGATYDTAAKR